MLVMASILHLGKSGLSKKVQFRVTADVKGGWHVIIFLLLCYKNIIQNEFLQPPIVYNVDITVQFRF